MLIFILIFIVLLVISVVVMATISVIAGLDVTLVTATICLVISFVGTIPVSIWIGNKLPYSKSGSGSNTYVDSALKHISLHEGAGARCNNCENRRSGKCTDGSFNYSGFDDAKRGITIKLRGSEICEYFKV